ncbi:hypothetical protein [Ralstonia sp. NFACC01]|uniref:hypothetical protein n=1 Tax=Ralstonia sp. NFACC01 TaxID=1566294 RepID=UPI0008EBA9BD|nr:hypothetical protein [Ralstonia sp. NFACC01]SFP99589.1 hypothetical protein SAMN03159417_03927 [Ralstonia sp. NFACC01]
MLTRVEGPELEAMRQHLAQAGCVFDFVLYRVERPDAPGIEIHRQALAGLFAQLEWPAQDVDLDRACPRSLGASEVRALMEEGGVLERAFLDPPYGAKLGAKDLRDWLVMLCLLPDDELDVADWVGNPDEAPERSAWSDYFDAGKEWWGIWCLTAYNPRCRTLCVLAASTTD